MTHVRRFLVVALASCTVCPSFAGETGFGPAPFWSATVNGDFVVAGAGTRSSANNQTDPFALPINIPGTPLKVFASWSYLTDTPSTAELARIRINGTDVIGAVAGQGDPDLCWSRGFAVSFLADVTSIVTGSGTYSIGSAIDHVPSASLGEGVSLLAIYDDGSAEKLINVYSGYTSTQSNETSVGETAWSWHLGAAYAGGPAHFFLNGIDGQTGADRFHVNDTDVSAMFTGGDATDAWKGLLGPVPGQNYYDHAVGDLSTLMSVGDTSVRFRTVGPSDCIGHSIGALAIVPEPETGGLLLLVLAARVIARRAAR